MEEEASKWDSLAAKCKRDHPGQRELPPSELAKRPPILDDWLSSKDWQILVDYKRILQPLEEATMILQGHGSGAAWGVVWQTIPVMEGLLKHFEYLKEQYGHVPCNPSDPLQVSPSQTQKSLTGPREESIDGARTLPAGITAAKTRKAKSSQQTILAGSVCGSPPPETTGRSEYHHTLCVQINEGWKKLDRYYELTDHSTVYVTALVLHPAYNWEYLESIWRSKSHWVLHHKRKIKQLWQQDYAATVVPTRDQVTPPNRRLQSKLLDLEEDQPEELFEDDYKRWCRRPRDLSLVDRGPLEFWTSDAISASYPRLQRLALNIFTIPAMSDEPERVFSSCGCMITPHRSTLSPKHVCCCQCLRSRSREELVTFQIFDQMSNRLRTLDVCQEAIDIDA